MLGYRNLNRHAGLMNRMAETLGINMTRVVATGQLPTEDWRNAVVACTNCSNPEGCAHWLAEQTAEQVDAAPDYCRNRDLLAALQPGPRDG